MKYKLVNLVNQGHLLFAFLMSFLRLSRRKKSPANHINSHNAITILFINNLNFSKANNYNTTKKDCNEVCLERSRYCQDGENKE